MYRPSLGQDLSLDPVDARILRDFVPEHQRLVSDNRHQSPLGFSGLQTLAVCQDAGTNEEMKERPTKFVNAMMSTVNICFNNRSQLFCGCSADDCCGRSLQNTRDILSAQSPSTSTVTSLPKVFWEEGRVAALSHTYAVKSPLAIVCLLYTSDAADE